MRLIRKLFREFLDRVLIPLLVYIQCRVGVGLPARTIHQELAMRVAADCAAYVETHMPRALQFIKREELWNYAWGKKNPAGLIAEFGVWNGYSINRFAQKTTDVIYGFDEPFAFIHIDCDTYESTLLVLDLLEPRIPVDVLIVFDEYLGYRGWREGEYKAWQEFVNRTGMTYEYLGFSSTGKVATRVTQIASA